MAHPARTLEEDYGLVLSRYVRNLTRDGRPSSVAPSPGHQVRTCPSCGAKSDFSLDPEGTWFRCSACGHYA